MSDIDILKEEIAAERIISLTQGYKDGKLLPIFGRDTLVEKICRTLVKFSHNNVILTGLEGIGKKSIMYAVAHAISKGTGIPELNKKRVYFFDCDNLADAFSKNPNLAADRIDACLRGAVELGNVILAIENIHGLLWGSYKFPSGVTFYNEVFYNLISHKKIQVIGTTCPDPLDVDGFIVGKWAEFVVFLDVPEMTTDECVFALQSTKVHREKEYGIKIDESAIKSAVYLSNRFEKDAKFPVKAISLLDEAIAKLRFDSPKQEKSNGILGIFKGDEDKPVQTLTEQHIAAVIAEKTAVPQEKLGEEDLKLLRSLEEEMSSRIIGQQEVIKAVAQTVRAVRAGFGDNKRPDGVFYFVGPSGVGKTEFALALSEVLYGDQSQLLRIDMSELTHPADATRLIGSAPGYVGYDEGGRLTEWVKKNPNSVILLDEFEKAHEGCWDIFLQMFDAGRLTDGKGITVDFSNTIVIMTSNIGSHLFAMDGKVREPAGFATYQKGEILPEDKFEIISYQIKEQMKRVFRPEFLNRIDEIIVFRPLEIPHLVKIAEMMLNKVAVKLVYDESILLHLAQQSYEPQYGARNLKREIQNLIIEPAANLVINGKLQRENPIKVVLSNGKLDFSH